MQPVGYEKSDLKITLDNISALKKVSFHLKYQTTYGQVIYVYGDHPLLGDNLIEKAIPLKFLNDLVIIKHLIKSLTIISF
jgi:hypothetical protein